MRVLAPHHPLHPHGSDPPGSSQMAYQYIRSITSAPPHGYSGSVKGDREGREGGVPKEVLGVSHPSFGVRCLQVGPSSSHERRGFAYRFAAAARRNICLSCWWRPAFYAHLHVLAPEQTAEAVSGGRDGAHFKRGNGRLLPFGRQGGPFVAQERAVTAHSCHTTICCACLPAAWPHGDKACPR